jgi:hypothetical protein
MGLCRVATRKADASCEVNESSVKAVLGLGGELLRNTAELPSNAGVLAPFVDPAPDGGIADCRLAGAGTLRGLSLEVLALLFGTDLGAILSSKADFKMPSA